MNHDIKVGKRRSLYRLGDEIQHQREMKKDWVNTWFLQGETVNTVSCPVTPGGILKKRLNTAINEGKSTKTKVIEDGGKPIHVGLMIKDPMRPHGCVFSDPDCIVRGDQQCDKTSVIYRMQCLTCLETLPP